MHQQIIFTPADMFKLVEMIGVLVTSVSVIVGAIVHMITKAKSPVIEQNAKIANHEKRIGDLEEKAEEVDERLDVGDKHFQRLESDTRTYQRGILALINHSIDGNNVEELKKCRDDLKEVIYRE